jgi:hypothetical protein
MSDLLIGRRAVYTRVTNTYDEAKKEMREVKRETFRGVIAALIVTGQYNYAAIVMLYDDGRLATHSISDVTVEGQASGDGPFR